MPGRAAIIGRVAREHKERRKKILSKPPKKKVAKLLVPLSERCSIPCNCRACLMLIFAAIFVSSGVFMCNMAFQAKFHPTTEEPRGNQTSEADVDVVDPYKGLRPLTYIGPAFIGTGAFIIVICSVLSFETRDKHLRDSVECYKEQKQTMNREYTNKALLGAEGPTVNVLANLTEVITTGGVKCACLFDYSNKDGKKRKQCRHKHSPSGPTYEDKWLPVVAMAASINEKEPMKGYAPKADGGDNPIYQYRGYDPKKLNFQHENETDPKT